MTKTYRNGPVGALMDEYERASLELKALIRTLSQDDFSRIVDTDTEDEDCRSVQTIMNHVVRAAYGYANYIRKQFGDNWLDSKEQYKLTTVEIACTELDQALEYTVETLQHKWELTFEEMTSNEMKVSWGQVYDFEQLLEHAIVHILRHRRQIERFKLRMSHAS